LGAATSATRSTSRPAGRPCEQPAQRLAQRRQRHLARLAEAEGNDAAEGGHRRGGGHQLAVAAGETGPLELAREGTPQRGRQGQAGDRRIALVGKQIQAVERPRGGAAPPDNRPITPRHERAPTGRA
jgi:hypothetical protein